MWEKLGFPSEEEAKTTLLAFLGYRSLDEATVAVAVVRPWIRDPL
jgi:hypothetical protein